MNEEDLRELEENPELMKKYQEGWKKALEKPILPESIYIVYAEVDMGDHDEVAFISDYFTDKKEAEALAERLESESPKRGRHGQRLRQYYVEEFNPRKKKLLTTSLKCEIL